MGKVLLVVVLVGMFLGLSAYRNQVLATVKEPAPKATGGIQMSSPNQQMFFSAFDYGPDSPDDKGTVEYWNYDYPGGPLHYISSVMCATVTGSDARFMFRIPEGWPGLSGIYVVAAVHDGGTPGVDVDVYGHAATWDPDIATGWCENGVSVTDYPIVGGNLVVHS